MIYSLRNEGRKGGLGAICQQGRLSVAYYLTEGCMKILPTVSGFLYSRIVRRHGFQGPVVAGWPIIGIGTTRLTYSAPILRPGWPITHEIMNGKLQPRLGPVGLLPISREGLT